jgi:CCR4-NOT transcription complex subunit 1
MVEQASTVIAQENMELACVFIQKTAVEKALLEIDKRLTPEYDARKLAKLEGRRYVDPVMYAYQNERMPEQIRIKATGAVNQQLAVYEDFSRNIPGFIPPSEAEIPFMLPKCTPQTRLEPPPLIPTSNTVLSGPPPPAANEDLLAIYEKLFAQMESYVQDLNISPSQIANQLVSNCMESMSGFPY